MVKADVGPLIDAIFDDVTEEWECPFIKEMCDALENGELWPRRMYENGQAAKVLNHVAFAALCEVLEAQDDVADSIWLQKVRSGEFQKQKGEGKGNQGKLTVEGKGKGKMEDFINDVNERKAEMKQELGESGKKVQDEGEGNGKADAKVGGVRKRKATQRKVKSWRLKFPDLPSREIVCALSMLPDAEPPTPPTRKRWSLLSCTEGKTVKRVRRKRGSAGTASGDPDDVIEISSGSSSTSEYSDEDSDDGSSDDGPDEGHVKHLKCPDVINGVDVSNWNPWLRIFMEFVGGVPGGN